MSRITLFALAGLAALVAVAGLASAEYYEGKPECPPDRFCTMSYGEGDEYSDANDTSPECEECSGPAPEDPAKGGPAETDCRVEEDGTQVCESHAGPSMPIDCGGEVCAYDGGGCDAPTSSMDHPNATANECPSLGGPADDPGPVDAPEEDAGTETFTDARRDAPAGAFVGALVALGLVALARKR